MHKQMNLVSGMDDMYAKDINRSPLNFVTEYTLNKHLALMIVDENCTDHINVSQYARTHQRTQINTNDKETSLLVREQVRILQTSK